MTKRNPARNATTGIPVSPAPLPVLAAVTTAAERPIPVQQELRQTTSDIATSATTSDTTTTKAIETENDGLVGAAEEALVGGDFRLALRLANDFLLVGVASRRRERHHRPPTRRDSGTGDSRHHRLRSPLASTWPFAAETTTTTNDTAGTYLAIHWDASGPTDRAAAVCLQSWYELRLLERSQPQQQLQLQPQQRPDRYYYRFLQPFRDTYFVSTNCNCVRDGPNDDNGPEYNDKDDNDKDNNTTQEAMSLELLVLWIKFCQKIQRCDVAIELCAALLHRVRSNTSSNTTVPTATTDAVDATTVLLVADKVVQEACREIFLLLCTELLPQYGATVATVTTTNTAAAATTTIGSADALLQRLVAPVFPIAPILPPSTTTATTTTTTAAAAAAAVTAWFRGDERCNSTSKMVVANNINDGRDCYRFVNVDKVSVQSCLRFCNTDDANWPDWLQDTLVECRVILQAMLQHQYCSKGHCKTDKNSDAVRKTTASLPPPFPYNVTTDAAGSPATTTANASVSEPTAAMDGRRQQQRQRLSTVASLKLLSFVRHGWWWKLTVVVALTARGRRTRRTRTITQTTTAAPPTTRMIIADQNDTSNSRRNRSSNSHGSPAERRQRTPTVPRMATASSSSWGWALLLVCGTLAWRYHHRWRGRCGRHEDTDDDNDDDDHDNADPVVPRTTVAAAAVLDKLRRALRGWVTDCRSLAANAAHHGETQDSNEETLTC